MYHHLGDWLAWTVNMTSVEEAMFLRMRDWSCRNQCALPPEVSEVRKIARVKTPAERHAVDAVLRKQWVLQQDGWHHPPTDKTIQDYTACEVIRQPKRDAARLRKQRSRERVAEMFSKLSAAGVVTRIGMTAAELAQLCEQHGINVVVTRDGPVTGREPSRVASLIGGPVGLPTNPNMVASLPVRDQEGADRVCEAVRAKGVTDTNAHHPTLHRLLKAGVGVEAFAMAAAEARARGKPFTYMLAMMEGRMADNAAAKPSDRRQSAAEDLVKAWAPALARKPADEPLDASARILDKHPNSEH
jgi:uncharacterized protein YdaU (DUF1376 family)